MQSSMNISNMFESHSNYKIGNIEETFRIILPTILPINKLNLNMTKTVMEGATNGFDAIPIVQLKTLQQQHNENVSKVVGEKCFPVLFCSDRKH